MAGISYEALAVAPKSQEASMVRTAQMQKENAQQAQILGAVSDSGTKRRVPEYIRRMKARNERYDGWLQFNASRGVAKRLMESGE